MRVCITLKQPSSNVQARKQSSPIHTHSVYSYIKKTMPDTKSDIVFYVIYISNFISRYGYERQQQLSH